MGRFFGISFARFLNTKSLNIRQWLGITGYDRGLNLLVVWVGEGRGIAVPLRFWVG